MFYNTNSYEIFNLLNYNINSHSSYKYMNAHIKWKKDIESFSQRVKSWSFRLCQNTHKGDDF